MQKAIVILEANLKENATTDFLKLLSEYLPETRRYEGFLDLKIHQCLTENTIILYQEWQSIQHYETYLKWRTDTGVMDIIRDTLTADPKIRYWNSVEV